MTSRDEESSSSGLESSSHHSEFYCDVRTSYSSPKMLCAVFHAWRINSRGKPPISQSKRKAKIQTSIYIPKSPSLSSSKSNKSHSLGGRKITPMRS
ncbi:hypothetical protein CICLE_v10013199mg [Citrus x clementina]|uniref:Uncharacterized protein n=1 Tax=Citrus clementina TaxID=85681 RepID=V4SMR5_CITCL|nr:hypothetical protein CICLE_v10013199mg [Citrus x clementina]